MTTITLLCAYTVKTSMGLQFSMSVAAEQKDKLLPAADERKSEELLPAFGTVTSRNSAVPWGVAGTSSQR